MTDANVHSTQYFYDAVDRPRQETYADGLFRTYAYDGVGNLTRRIDQIGQITNYAYSDLYFLLGRTYPSAVNDSFTYDLSGRMLSGQRGSWPITFAYDGANRITQTVQNGHTISYSYDIPGRKRTATYPGGRVITEHSDARSRLDHTDDAASPPSIVQYTYDPADRVTLRTYRNGTTAAYNYNSDDWVTALQHSDGSTPIAGFTYAYYNEGNKQFENKLQDNTHSEAYQYDTTYRLITYNVGTLAGSVVPFPSTQTAYSLDPVGNWNSKTTNGIIQTRMHNSTNELIEINSTGLTYDNNGNLTNDGAYMYGYDEENRLTTATRLFDSALVGQYRYDALDRRVQKIADPAGSSATTAYFYDDARIVEEQDGLGTTQATYVYGNYVDEVLTMDRGGQTYYYHQNALWSVEAVTDSTATPVERYSYDAYGQVSVTDGSFNPVPRNAWDSPHSAIGNPWTFTGRELDEETRLFFYRSRYYDADKGRFLQRDPLEYINSANLYEYVRDNPVNAVDPTGNVCCENLTRFTYTLNPRNGSTSSGGLRRVVKEIGDVLKQQYKDWKQDMFNYCFRSATCWANIMCNASQNYQAIQCLPKFDCYAAIGYSANGRGPRTGDTAGGVIRPEDAGFNYQFAMVCFAKCETDCWHPNIKQPPDVGLDLIKLAFPGGAAIRIIKTVVTLGSWANYVANWDD